MTTGPVLHALVDLVQQCEKDKCSFSDMRPYTAAMQVLRDNVRVKTAPPEGGAISVDALRNAMQDHYWDSLEPYRTTVMAHMEGVLRLLTSPEPQREE